MDDPNKNLNEPQPTTLDEVTQAPPAEPQAETAAVPEPRAKRSVWRLVWNICLIGTVVFLVVYLGFFSESSVVRGIAYQRTIDSLKECIDQQQDSLNYYRELNRRLSTDPSLTEQVVREQYNMKRDNEDVYLFK